MTAVNDFDFLIIFLFVILPLAIAFLTYKTIFKKFSKGKRILLFTATFVAAAIIIFYIARFLFSLFYPVSIDYLYIDLPETLTYCQYGTIEAYAAATEETLNANSIKIKQLLDSNGQPVAGFDIISSAFPLKRFQQAKKIVSFNCGSACSGTYTMVIATSYVRLQRTVTCA